jgi:hypothetical protein
MIKNLAHMPKRLVTMDEVLGLDETRKDIMECANHIAESIDDITDLAVVYITKDGKVHSHYNGCTASTALWMLEIAKLQLLNDDR